MTKVFPIYHYNTSQPSITIGTNGFRICDCDRAGWPLSPIRVMFDKIISVSVVTSWTQKGYSSFVVTVATEPPYDCEIRIRDNSQANECQQLILSKHAEIESSRDAALGI